MFETAFSAVAALAVGVFAWRALRPVHWKEALRFCVVHELPLEEANAPIVLRMLATRRAARMTGTILGIAVPLVLQALGVRILGSGAGWATAWIGYFAGALFGAWRSPHVARRGARHALLVPRRTSDYVSRATVIVPVVTLAIALFAIAADLFGPRRTDPWIAPRGQIALPIVGAVLVALVAVVTVRRVVGRRQDASTPLLVATDDALRADALQIVTGAGIAMIAQLCAITVINAAATSDVQVFRWVFPWVGMAMFFVAIQAWFSRHLPWPVRRASLAAA